MLSILLVLVQVAAVVQGSPAPCKHVLKETFNPAKEWVKQGPAPTNHEFTMRIALAQPKFNILEEHLYAVSDPESPRYGEHLSMEETHELMAPSPDALEAVNKWLVSHGFDISGLQRSPSKDWLKVKTSVQKAEEMLNTTYHVWKHSGSGEYVVRTTRWSVPDFLADHIDLVHPTTMFGGSMKPKSTTFLLDDSPVELPQIKAKLSPGVVDPSCNTTITPTCLKQLYNATDYVPKVPSKGGIAISSYLEQFANFADLQSFYTQFVLEAAAVNASFNVVPINGGLNNQTLSEAGAEADLDIEYAFGLSFPIPATAYTTGGRPPFIPSETVTTNTNEPYLDWVDFVLKQKKVPNTISTSYGEPEQTVPFSYALNVCARFAVLGARGVTLTFSSGDGGVGDNNPDPATQQCQTNDGRNATKFLPSFPAGCPFVTSVGGTVNVPERAVTRFGSGGGFSTYFKRPAYQEKEVNAYLRDIGNTNAGLFDRHGRGIPDVAAQGDNFVIVLSGRNVRIGGTSASSPTFAGLVALLNDARLAAGKRPLGFLNPLIYKFPGAFNDITVGSNPGCGTQGFSCRPGWDAVTGLGTPNFGLLKDIVLKH